MALFRRRPRTGAPDATAALESISRFWSWWHATGADQIAQAIESSTVEAMAPTIAEQVAAIDADLSWELSPGNGLNRHPARGLARGQSGATGHGPPLATGRPGTGRRLELRRLAPAGGGSGRHDAAPGGHRDRSQ